MDNHLKQLTSSRTSPILSDLQRIPGEIRSVMGSVFHILELDSIKMFDSTSHHGFPVRSVVH